MLGAGCWEDLGVHLGSGTYHFRTYLLDFQIPGMARLKADRRGSEETNRLRWRWNRQVLFAIKARKRVRRQCLHGQWEWDATALLSTKNHPTVLGTVKDDMCMGIGCFRDT